MNRVALVLLIIALILGAFLRFHDLDALQMSADEGATWAAADAPSIRDVVAIQRTHNAGKLPVHDLMLHGWIATFRRRHVCDALVFRAVRPRHDPLNVSADARIISRAGRLLRSLATTSI